MMNDESMKLKGNVEIKLEKEGDGSRRHIRLLVRIQGKDVASMSALDFLYHQGLTTTQETGGEVSCVRSHPERMEFYKSGKRLGYIDFMRSIERELWAFMIDELGVDRDEKAILDYLYLEPFFDLYSRRFDGEQGCCKAFYEDRVRGNCPEICPDSMGYEEYMKKCSRAYDGESERKIWEFAGCYYDEEDRLRPRHEARYVRTPGNIKKKFLYYAKISIPPLLIGKLFYLVPSENLLAGFSSNEAGADWMKKRGIAAGAGREEMLKHLSDQNLRSAMLEEIRKEDSDVDWMWVIMGRRNPFINSSAKISDGMYNEIIKYKEKLELESLI